MVYVSPLDLYVFGENTYTVSEQAPVRLLIVPVWIHWVNLQAPTSLLISLWISSSEKYKTCRWSGVPLSGVEGWGVLWDINEDELVIVLPGFQLLSSSVHVTISPARGVAAEVSHCQEGWGWDINSVKAKRSVVGAVVVQVEQFHCIQF